MFIEDRLQDIFSRRWLEHFDTLFQVLGFSLSAYSENGAPLLTSASRSPTCTSVRNAANNADCEIFCRTKAMDALSAAEPRWFACPSRVMGFALPVLYLDQRAVLLGRGSFASYNDFRPYLDQVRTSSTRPVRRRCPQPGNRLLSGSWRRTCRTLGTQRSGPVPREVAGKEQNRGLLLNERPVLRSDERADWRMLPSQRKSCHRCMQA